MIIKPDLYATNKRWVYKLDGLGLDKIKVTSDETNETDDGEQHNEIIPALQPPKLIISEEIDGKSRLY